MQNEIYIVGGGPSLRGFPFEKLRSKETIAVNMAALDVPEPTYCLTADSSIFRKIQKKYFKDVKTTWVLVTNEKHIAMQMIDGKFQHVKSGFVYNLFCVDMLIRNAGTDGIGFTFNDFRTGFNSGFCAFQLAVLLRYQKIYLLGFDLKKQVDKTLQKDAFHYHNRYHGHPIKEVAFDRYYNNFVKAIKEVRKRTDIQIVLGTPNSRLEGVLPYEAVV